MAGTSNAASDVEPPNATTHTNADTNNNTGGDNPEKMQTENNEQDEELQEEETKDRGQNTAGETYS